MRRGRACGGSRRSLLGCNCDTGYYLDTRRNLDARSSLKAGSHFDTRDRFNTSRSLKIGPSPIANTGCCSPKTGIGRGLDANIGRVPRARTDCNLNTHTGCGFGFGASVGRVPRASIECSPTAHIVCSLGADVCRSPNARICCAISAGSRVSASLTGRPWARFARA